MMLYFLVDEAFLDPEEGKETPFHVIATVSS